MSKLTQDIVNSVLDFLKKEDTSETAFNDQALRLFNYQYRNNLPYQMYCRQKGKTPRMVKLWGDIPSVPINAFKELTLSCEDPDHAEDVFSLIIHQIATITCPTFLKCQCQVVGQRKK